MQSECPARYLFCARNSRISEDKVPSFVQAVDKRRTPFPCIYFSILISNTYQTVWLPIKPAQSVSKLFNPERSGAILENEF